VRKVNKETRTKIANALLKISGRSSKRFPVEPVIVELVDKRGISEAIELLEKLHPSQAFAAEFARQLLPLQSCEGAERFENDFVKLKTIAGEKISTEEADIILARYTESVRSYYNDPTSAPPEIVKAASNKALARFLSRVISSKKGEKDRIDYLRQWFPLLEGRIK
jgi:uncharacterized protein (DUF2267 family)